MEKKLKLKDIKPNPYRNFEIYPIREDKILQLMESIRTTTFWGGLVGREKDGKIEIAFGHHRLEALRKMFDPEAEIDITVENLSDEDMMKMMSRENAEEWACPIAAIDDAVKAVRDHLTANRDSLRKLLSSTADEDKRIRIGARVIAKFMGKKVGTVEGSLKRLNLIERGEVDREALYLMPSAAAADHFAAAVRYYDLKKENQKIVAEKIVADRRFGERSIYETVTEFFPREQIKKITDDRASYYEVKLRLALRQITSLRKTLAAFTGPIPQTWGFLGGVTTPEDITPETFECFNRAVHALSESLRKVGERLETKIDWRPSI
jgi:ParB-like chromosome segregation protein Spo0J